MPLKFILVSFFIAHLAAQEVKFVPNYDEEKINPYTLPEILKMENGEPVTKENWLQRRAEILSLFENHVFGKRPAGEIKITRELGAEKEVFGGIGTRQFITLHLSGQGKEIAIHVLFFRPKNVSSAPCILGLNFGGNHTVLPDEDIPLPSGWQPKQDQHAFNLARGSQQAQWSPELIIQNGMALATAYCGDIEPDKIDGSLTGGHALFPRDDSPSAWGTISVWAWGLSKMLDGIIGDGGTLTALPNIDAKKIAVVGHSRLGKAAVWAGATDERFTLVISNNSGCGGAALERRNFGETVGRINRAYPYWFCKKHQDYNENEAAMPVDNHELLALIAPRNLYVASATLDLWSDPKGEFISLTKAAQAWNLLENETLTEKIPMPAADTAITGTHLAYHIRTGKHDILPWDWQHYISFAKKVWKE